MMVIDLDRCTGCQACVVACHAENNVPTVGPRGGRPWAGLGTGSASSATGRASIPTSRRASCPMYVPAVRARAVRAGLPGLRHLSQRRREPQRPGLQPLHRHALLRQQLSLRSARIFNWFEPYFPEPLNEQLNPDVTVRGRGVMEKCTFCIQRIKRGEDDGQRRDDRPMRRRRRSARLRPDLPARGDHLRRPERPQQPDARAAATASGPSGSWKSWAPSRR